MEAAERRILPLPKRRVTSGSTMAAVPEPLRQPVTPNLLFSRLLPDSDATSTSQIKSDDSTVAKITPSTQESQYVQGNETPTDLDESEEDDDECTGCRDWLDNVKNKKKRKIPTSAVMGHTNSNSSPVLQVHGMSASPGRSMKSKTRRRRTWDVSSESRPDASLRLGGTTHAPAVFNDALHGREGLASRTFEFTCDSPVARNLPAPPPAAVEILPSEPISVATQTSPTLAAMEPILPPRHRRTKEEKAYDRQRVLAKQRREARAKLKPGEKETVWICQFCEFESIFGYAPLALINGYTERVRAARRAALERKRLLEKARSKGKKKKKHVPAKATNHNNTTLPPSDNKITPTHQNGGKTGIDKAIGPGSTSCTCCDHRRDKEDRDRKHRERYARPAPPPPPPQASGSHHHHHHHHYHHTHQHSTAGLEIPRDDSTENGSQGSGDEIVL